MLTFKWEKTDYDDGRKLTLNGTAIINIIPLVGDNFYLETVGYLEMTTYSSLGKAKRAAEILLGLPRKQAEERRDEEAREEGGNDGTCMGKE